MAKYKQSLRHGLDLETVYSTIFQVFTKNKKKPLMINSSISYKSVSYKNIKLMYIIYNNYVYIMNSNCLK